MLKAACCVLLRPGGGAFPCRLCVLALKSTKGVEGPWRGRSRGDVIGGLRLACTMDSR
jgi:hypothetical protein